MNSAVLSTLAALGGSSIGALGPIFSNYVLQRGQTQRDLLLRQVIDREALYSDFINEASRIYARSLTHSFENPEELVSLYALVRRIRLLASNIVVNAAESVVRQVHNTESPIALSNRCGRKPWRVKKILLTTLVLPAGRSCKIS